MNKKIMIPSVIVVLLLIAGGAFFFINKDESSEQNKKEQTELKIPDEKKTEDSVDENGFREEEETIGEESNDSSSLEPVEKNETKNEEEKEINTEKSDESNESSKVSEEVKQSAIQLVNRAFEAAKPINDSPDGYGDLTNYAANYNYGQKYALNDWIATTGYGTSFDPSSLEVEKATNEGTYRIKFNINGDGKPVYTVQAYYLPNYDQMQLKSVSKTKYTDDYVMSKL